MILHHEIVEGARAQRTAFVLHGILGSAQNWRMYARKLAEALPGWRFVLVDLRNHGESVGAAPPHTIAACAADLARLAQHLGAPPQAVIGHSFGGKVALVYARDHGGALEQAWALDVTPGRGDADSAAAHSEVVEVLRALRQIALPLKRRRDLVEILTGRGFSGTLARWMTTNLRLRDEGDRDSGYVWAFELDGVEAMLDDYLRTDLWPFLEQRAAAHEAPHVHLLRAEQSSRWSPGTLSRLERLDAQRGAFTFHLLPDAGHWVHVDNPDGLRELLVAALAV